MAALNDFYKANALGRQIGTDIREGRDRREQKQFANKLAGPLAEGNYQGAANLAFQSGRIDQGVQLQKLNRQVASEDREEAAQAGEQFQQSYGRIASSFAEIAKLRKQGVILTDDDYRTALERNTERMASMVQGDEQMGKAMQAYLPSLMASSPEEVMAYAGEFSKNAGGGNDGSNVQSKFTDDEGYVTLVFRDGSTKRLNKRERNPYQITDIGGVPTAIDRRTGEAIAISTPGQVGGNKAEISAIQKRGDAATEAELKLPETEEKVGKILSLISKLQPGGKNNKGFLDAYGIRIPGAAVLPSSARKDAEAIISQLVESETLEKVGLLSGPKSDKDIELVRSSATRLSDPNISDDAAEEALEELEGAYRRLLRTTRDLANSGVSAGGAPQPAAPADAPPPQDVDPSDWAFMTPEERALFQ